MTNVHYNLNELQRLYPTDFNLGVKEPEVSSTLYQVPGENWALASWILSWRDLT